MAHLLDLHLIRSTGAPGAVSMRRSKRNQRVRATLHHWQADGATASFNHGCVRSMPHHSTLGIGVVSGKSGVSMLQGGSCRRRCGC